jgi:hypothetical protein
MDNICSIYQAEKKCKHNNNNNNNKHNKCVHEIVNWIEAVRDRVEW